MPAGIVDEPRLVVETVLEVVDDEWQHIVVGCDDGEVGAVFGLLEPYELLHALFFVEHAATGIAHEEHVGVGDIVGEILTR